MNQKIETLKIKVNSIAEIFAEMRKLKNSGEEWKILKKHQEWTVGKDKKGSKDTKVSFILSNGEKKVDIVFEKDDCEFVDIDGIFGGKKNYQELREIFPEDKTPFLSLKHPENYSSSLKVIGEISKEHTTIMRLFNAWSLNDVRKILVDYYMANKAEIDQFNEKNYSQGVADPLALAAQWLEVREDDQLFYIWVGKRDTKKGYYWGGGEWEICLRKSDLMGRYTRNGHKLIECVGSQGTQTLKSFLTVHWMVLTDAGGGNRGNEYAIAGFENHPVGFDPDCCDQNGNSAFPAGGKPNDNQKPNPILGQNSDLSQSSNHSLVKEQVRRYMEQNGIFRLTLDNGKLVVEYNNSSKKEEKEINSQQLKTIQDYLKGHNNVVNFEQLKSGSNPSTTNPKNLDYTFWIVGGIGLVLVVGMFVYYYYINILLFFLIID